MKTSEREFPSASYDAWKTRSPDDDRPEDEFEPELEEMDEDDWLEKQELEMPLRVKLLEWEGSDSRLSGFGITGRYIIEGLSGKWTVSVPTASVSTTGPAECERKIYPSLLVAKSAAQSDYEDRIRSALTSPTDIGRVHSEPASGEDESGWVIEHGASEVSRPRYWGGVHGWTYDHMQAVRFAREVDAQSQAAADDDGVPDSYRVCEHIWTA